MLIKIKMQNGSSTELLGHIVHDDGGITVVQDTNNSLCAGIDNVADLRLAVVSPVQEPATDTRFIKCPECPHPASVHDETQCTQAHVLDKDFRLPGVQGHCRCTRGYRAGGFTEPNE